MVILGEGVQWGTCKIIGCPSKGVLILVDVWVCPDHLDQVVKEIQDLDGDHHVLDELKSGICHLCDRLCRDHSYGCGPG